MTRSIFSPEESAYVEQKPDNNYAIRKGAAFITLYLNNVDHEENKITILNDALTVVQRKLDKNESFTSKIGFGVMSFIASLFASHSENFLKIIDIRAHLEWLLIE